MPKQQIDLTETGTALRSPTIDAEDVRRLTPPMKRSLVSRPTLVVPREIRVNGPSSAIVLRHGHGGCAVSAGLLHVTIISPRHDLDRVRLTRSPIRPSEPSWTRVAIRWPCSPTQYVGGIVARSTAQS